MFTLVITTAAQFMSEKIGGVEGTKFTDEFTQLERVSVSL